MSWFLKWLIGEPQPRDCQKAGNEEMENQLYNSVENHKYATLKLKKSSLNDIEDSVRAHDLLEDVLSRIAEREAGGNARRS